MSDKPKCPEYPHEELLLQEAKKPEIKFDKGDTIYHIPEVEKCGRCGTTNFFNAPKYLN